MWLAAGAPSLRASMLHELWINYPLALVTLTPIEARPIPKFLTGESTHRTEHAHLSPYHMTLIIA